MTSPRAGLVGGIRSLFEGLAGAHRVEEVDSYLRFFTRDTVWVTSRGVCFEARQALGDYLRQVIPGGPAGGSVEYVGESVHEISPGTAVAVIDQTYLDKLGQPRDFDARHTHMYVLTQTGGDWRTAAGQNTVRA